MPYSEHNYFQSIFGSFKIHLIGAYLKFHFKLLFRSASVTIPEHKFSSSTFLSIRIQFHYDNAEKDMLFLVVNHFCHH